MFVMPLRIRKPAFRMRESDRLQSWQKTFLDVEGHRIAVRFRNPDSDRPVVVFVHGITGSVDFWPLILPDDFCSAYRCIAVSLPGHAPSVLPEDSAAESLTPSLFAELVRKSLDQLVPGQRAHVVGWSTGGFTALISAALLNDRILSATSISGFVRGHWNGSLGLLQRLAASRFPRQCFSMVFNTLRNRPALLNRVVRKFAGRFRTDAAHREFQDALRMARMVETFQSLDAESIRVVMASIRGFDVTDQLARIECPVTVIQGALDSIILPAEAEWIGAHVRNSTAINLPEAGHLFYAEALPQILTHIRTTIGR